MAKLGELNGPWLVLFKALLVLMPLWAAHSAWVTTEIIQLREFKAAAQASRYTCLDAATDQKKNAKEHQALLLAITRLQK